MTTTWILALQWQRRTTILLIGLIISIIGLHSYTPLFLFFAATYGASGVVWLGTNIVLASLGRFWTDNLKLLDRLLWLLLCGLSLSCSCLRQFLLLRSLLLPILLCFFRVYDLFLCDVLYWLCLQSLKTRFWHCALVLDWHHFFKQLVNKRKIILTISLPIPCKVGHVAFVIGKLSPLEMALHWKRIMINLFLHRNELPGPLLQLFPLLLLLSLLVVQAHYLVQIHAILGLTIFHYLLTLILY